jgi:hypothetical protein
MLEVQLNKYGPIKGRMYPLVAPLVFLGPLICSKWTMKH